MARKKKEMKPGDLVMLSSSAIKRNDLYWYRQLTQDGNLIGMVIRIKDIYYAGGHGHLRHRRAGYIVRWIGDDKIGPRGRKRWDSYFLRSDLKFVPKYKFKKNKNSD